MKGGAHYVLHCVILIYVTAIMWVYNEGRGSLCSTFSIYYSSAIMLYIITTHISKQQWLITDDSYNSAIE